MRKLYRQFIYKKNVYCIELKSEHKCIGAFETRVYGNESSFGYVLNK